ncbi:hypothetical protein HAX54_042236 [Datura stramonium]|uniref:Uncharacterized protein n=1 Tax=Datura stramonium TaxID=4076 RepID=A0ABS8RP84_DATST|nr:hypothetical protein [Datura stramonium]
MNLAKTSFWELSTFNNDSCRVLIVEKEEVNMNECSEDVGEGRERFYRGEVGYWEDKKGVENGKKGDLKGYCAEYGGSRGYLGYGLVVRELDRRSTGEPLLGPPMLQLIYVLLEIYRRYMFLNRRFAGVSAGQILKIPAVCLLVT